MIRAYCGVSLFLTVSDAASFCAGLIKSTQHHQIKIIYCAEETMGGCKMSVGKHHEK